MRWYIQVLPAQLLHSSAGIRLGSVDIFNSSYWEQWESYIFEDFRSYCGFDNTQVVYKELSVSLFFFNKTRGQIWWEWSYHLRFSKILELRIGLWFFFYQWKWMEFHFCPSFIKMWFHFIQSRDTRSIMAVQ
jgi:hypothetical protein